MKRVDLIQKGGFAPGEHLVTATAEDPVPQQGQVVIDVKASAVNPVDWKMAELGIFVADPLPAALGCDVAGIVVAASTDQESMVGKRVVTYLGADKTNHKVDKGAYVEKVVADADVVQELPDAMSFASAAALPVGALTAELLVNHHESTLAAGDPIVIWGASSSVGHYAVQIALKRGLKPIAVASGRHRDNLMSLGALGFVDYTKDDVSNTVKDLCTKSSKLNGAVDCIGTGDTFTTCCNLLVAYGDTGKDKHVSTTSGWGMPDAPKGVTMKPVDLGSALENDLRGIVKKALPEIVSLVPQKVRSVKGPVAAETVHEAFMINKKGVSGEKVVIEWT